MGQTENRMTAFRCLSCEGMECTPVLSGVRDYYLRTPYRVDYVRCGHCALVQQYPVPRDVGPFYSAYPVHARKGRLHEYMRRLLLGRIYFDATTMPAGGVLLDFGCGDGWFLGQIRDSTLTRLGFERDPGLARRVSDQLGAPVYSNVEDLMAKWKGRVDQITLHFVLEHLTDLRQSFEMFRDLLKPGGSIYALVPNIESREFKLFGRRWHGLDAPRHVMFPCPATLTRVLQPLNMEVVRDRFVRFPNTFAGSLAITFGGRFRQVCFLACLPLGVVWTLMAPSGNRAMEIRKRT
jgi:SAM-dependent methyltransferase